MFREFGAKVTNKLIELYAKSPNWHNGKFHNIEKTSMDFRLQNFPEFLYKQIWQRKGRYPAKALPVLPFDKTNFLSNSSKIKLIWYGHSAILLRINNKTLLIDPMLGSDAGPGSLLSIKRFSANTLQLIDDFPAIDLVLITHDHYDHLDLSSINKLKSKTRHFFAALGVGRHLQEWGIDKNKITEFDWWSHQNFDDISIHFTPSRHFSGRGIRDRFKSLWGGWAIRTGFESIYISGDGGYGEHFRDVGNKLGPFDFGLMECGQYNENWHQLHMYPEESVQAALDAKVQKIMAIHWGAFALAQHGWIEPIERFTREAEQREIPFSTPDIGQLIDVSDEIITPWWSSHN